MGNPVVEKMAFNEELLLFTFFWLCRRRLRLARARRRRIAAAQSIELVVVVSQWRFTSHIAIAAALRLLLGNQLERRVWAKPRSASFYQDIVPGWNDAYFKANFCLLSHATFAYLVNELQPVMQRQELIRSTIPLDRRVAIALWRLGANVKYRTISHLFGVALSSVCVIVHEVCEAIVVVLGPQYIKLPQGEGWQTVVNGFLQRWQFPQYAGALIGSHIPIIVPPVKAKDYYI